MICFLFKWDFGVSYAAFFKLASIFGRAFSFCLSLHVTSLKQFPLAFQSKGFELMSAIVVKATLGKTFTIFFLLEIGNIIGNAFSG